MEAELPPKSTSWRWLGVLGLWAALVLAALGGCMSVAAWAGNQLIENIGRDTAVFDATLTIAHESNDDSMPALTVVVTRANVSFDFADIEVGEEQVETVEIVPYNGWQSSYGGALELRVEPISIGYVSDEPVCTGAVASAVGVDGFQSTRLGYDRDETRAEDNINIRCVVTSRRVEPGAVRIRAVTDSGEAVPETVMVLVNRERLDVEPDATIEVSANPGVTTVRPRAGELWVPRDQGCEFQSPRLLLDEGETIDCILVYKPRPGS